MRPAVVCEVGWRSWPGSCRLSGLWYVHPANENTVAAVAIFPYLVYIHSVRTRCTFVGLHPSTRFLQDVLPTDFTVEM